MIQEHELPVILPYFILRERSLAWVDMSVCLSAERCVENLP